MKTALVLVAVAGLAMPAPALAASAVTTPDTPAATTQAAPTTNTRPVTAAATTTAGSVLVARYAFDGGVVDGKAADTSGRGAALAVRTADQGQLRVLTGPRGRHVAFPAACAAGAQTCPRALLEAPDDVDLNPGVRKFRWSARVNVTKAQVVGSANIVQKGVATTGSQWKMQVGRTQGRAQCVVVGTGSATAYLVRSTVSVADGLWHKVLCERSGGTLTVYVDDVARGQRAIPADLAIANNLPLRVGGPNFNARSDMYHGQLDEVYAELG